MGKIPHVAFLFCLAAVVRAEEPPRALPVEPTRETVVAVDDTVVSRTGQFRVSGGASLVRGTIALIAEETKSDLLQLIGGDDAWKTPLQIRLHGAPGEPAPSRLLVLRLVSIDGAAALQLDVHLAQGLDRESLELHLTEALVYERSIRAGRTGSTERNLDLPPWLATGLREAVAWKSDNADRALYQALFQHGGLYKLDDLFSLPDQAARENLDGATRAAFRVSSGALVSALLSQPDSAAGFRAFLDEIASFEGEMPALLRRHFPGMNLSETSLAKWWTLQLANQGGLAILTDVMPVRTTERALAEALRFQVRDADGNIQLRPIVEWADIVALPEAVRANAVRPAQDALVRLSHRCFPSYRPLIVGYHQILASLAKNETEDIPARLADLEKNRATMVAKAERGRDYLDWFEITRARETSGAFTDYLALKDRLKHSTHRRTDPVSLYLDRLDQLFNRGLDDPAPKKSADPVIPELPSGDPGLPPPDALQGNIPEPPVNYIPDELPDIPLDH